MNSSQKKLQDEILSGPRTKIAGPMHAWFLNPEYGSLIQKVGAFCRYNTSLPARLSELAIIIVARHWNASAEWVPHRKIALKEGISKEILDCVENNLLPDFKKDDEALVYEISKSILENKGVSDDLFQKAEREFGKKTLLDLTAIIGYYCNIAIQVNVFDIPAEGGRKIQTLN